MLNSAKIACWSKLNPGIHRRFIGVCSNEARETPNRLFGGNQRGGKVMDPITASLAANVVAVLAPYVAVGAQEFVRNAGKDAYEKAKTMLASLKAKWTGDEEATDALTRFED